MSGRLVFGPLLAMGVRGLRSRALLAVGSVVLAAIALAAAVVGPMYQAGAARSFLVSELRLQPNYLTGMTFTYRPTRGQNVPHAIARASGEANRMLGKGFLPPHAFVWSQTTWAPRLGPRGGQPTLVSAPGACAHLVLTGRCPTKANQIILLSHDASTLGLRIGDTFAPWGDARRLTVVGTYVPRPSGLNFWFESLRLESIPEDSNVNELKTRVNPNADLPYQPAPFVTALSTFTSARTVGWHLVVDKRLRVVPTTTVADLQTAAHQAAAVLRANPVSAPPPGPGYLRLEIGNALPSIAHQIVQRRSTARSTVSPAVISVVLVALVLLVRLLGSAMDLRRNELALASLRGFSRRQMWVLGMLEPGLMLGLATPFGVVGGYLAARWLGRVWLVPGLPMPFGWSSVGAVALVLLVTALVAAGVVRGSVNEPLSAQIAGIRRPGRAGRWGAITRLTLVAAAVVVLAATLARSGQSSPDAIDLLLPILLAVAAGLVTAVIAQVVAGQWARWTSRRRGLFGYVASRTISRRREGTLVILPLTAALAVSIFAAGVFTSAATWRASDAATLVGAGQSFSTNLSLGRAVALTHQIDPRGRWLMAVGASFTPTGQDLVVDAPRLARVATWPGTWTPGRSPAQIGRELSPTRPSVEMTGTTLTMTVDNRVHGGYRSLASEITFIDDLGDDSSVIIGPFAPGVSTRTVRLPMCQGGCLLQEMTIGGGPAALNEKMRGTAEITRFEAGGRPVSAALALPWRRTEIGVNTPNAVSGNPRVAGGRLTVRFDSADADSVAQITPTDVPRTWPVLWGRTSTSAGASGAGATSRVNAAGIGTVSVRSIGTTESMALLGPTGMMVDYTMFSRIGAPIGALTEVRILARSDTPAPVVAALAAHGISRPQTLAAQRHVLDEDAFALALNLYVVVTVIVILLALTGLGANLAVQMPARRRDAASMRVVGMRKRSVIAAVIAEFVVVMGAAAVAGVGAGSLAQYVVVRTVTLGYADSDLTPRLLATFSVSSALELLGAVVAVLFAVGVTVASLTVRGARTSILREESR